MSNAKTKILKTMKKKKNLDNSDLCLMNPSKL